MKFNLIILLSLLLSNFSFCQNEKTTTQDFSWETLKNTAHQIGFCIYHPSQNHCIDHSNELAKREKTTPEDMDVYYFEMKKEWAKNRLDEWEKRQEQPADKFLILFDVAQIFSLEKPTTKTSNLFQGFILMDLTDTIDFTFFKINENESKMVIQSDGKNALMENTLWREFMTHRLGRFSPRVDFKLIGKNAETDFENFKEAFLNLKHK